MTHQAKIIAGGKIVIPAELRRALGMKDGDRVVIDREDGKLVIRTWDQVVRDIQMQMKKNIRKPFTVDEFIAERREEAARE